MFFVVFFLSLVGSTLTSSLSKRGGGHNAPLINCPTCEHHVCDLYNLKQCEVCQIHIPHEHQPPVDVKCLQAGHCHEDNHHHCCDNEGCVAHYFGQHASSAVTQPASSVKCPRCHEGICDFINGDQCFACKIDLKNDGTYHVHCLKEHEHCDPTHHNTFCCSDEPCIAQAFGHHYPTSHSTTTTTKSATPTFPTNTTAASTTTTPHSSNLSPTTTIPTTNASPQTNPTSTGGHKTNQTYQLLNDIHCPVLSCNHHICDITNTNLCEVCQIHFKNQLPQGTNCLTVDHHCKDDDHHLCCTDMACVENVFGNIPKSGASLNGNKMYCPDCTIHGCNFISCETCVYHGIDHNTRLHKFKTCEPKECSHDDVICCHDYHCIDKLFGTHFQTTPTIQTTTNPSITSKTDRTNGSTTSTAATTTTTKAHNTTPDTTVPTIDSSVSLNGQTTHHVPSSTTLMNTTSATASTTPASSPNGQTTHHVPSSTTLMNTTSATASTTPASSPNGTTNSCVDELKNCAMFKSMGVCHASPQEGTKYDIAFQCKRTCDRCNDTYEPLTTVALTTSTTIGPTQAPIHCQVCGDYDSNIPCDLASVYKGSFVACTEGAYCMNDVVHEQGNVKTFKRCVNETVCRNLWMSQTSDQDHCTNYGNVMVSGDYSCHYCCTTDRCNRGLIPDPSTYYIKA
ncbi:mucin-3A-like isoform X3 [Crassostrea angulata]|uniref:mucin-3A-like isoform X3 n=1 Tax=Magallana angulata TaxID=2784310 RepID=UPI0022B0B88E|nr:mucin-3A-like isoform X3 [Crassostrea angulata]